MYLIIKIWFGAAVTITPKSSVDDVIVFMKQHDLDNFTDLFRKEKINGKVFLKLTDEDLVEYGVSRKVDRKRILEEIDELRQQGSYVCIISLNDIIDKE